MIFSFITDDFNLTFILILLGLKVLLTSLCIGFGIFGGVFSPALFIGAASGQLMSNLLGQISVFAPSTVLAISGMAAVAACVVWRATCCHNDYFRTYHVIRIRDCCARLNHGGCNGD